MRWALPFLLMPYQLKAYVSNGNGPQVLLVKPLPNTYPAIRIVQYYTMWVDHMGWTVHAWYFCEGMRTRRLPLPPDLPIGLS